MKLRIVTTRQEFEELATPWQRLWPAGTANRNVFSTHAWHRLYLSRYNATGSAQAFKLAIVVGEIDGQTELIIPLTQQRRFGVTTLKWIGDPVSQYGDVLIGDLENKQDTIEQGLAFAARETRSDCLILERVHVDSAISISFHSKNAIALRKHRAPKAEFSFFESADAYVGRLSSGRRKKQRRLWRRLSDVAPLKFDVLLPGPEAKIRTEQALAMKRAMLALQGTYSRGFSNPDFIPFFLEAAADPSAGVGFEIATLVSGDKLVAAEIGFRNAGTYVAHIGVFDNNYRKFAPGHLLMEKIMRRLFELGVETYDFLPPDDEYKSEWGTSAADVTDFAIPVTSTGYVYCQMEKLRQPLTSLAKRAIPAQILKAAINK